MVKDIEKEKEKTTANVTTVEPNLEKKEQTKNKEINKTEVKNKATSKEAIKNNSNSKTEAKKEEQKPTVVKEEPKQLFTQVPNDPVKVFPLFSILVAVFISLLILGYFVFSIVMSSSNKIFSGIYIKSIDVSDLTSDEAKNKVNTYLESCIPEEIVLTHGDYETTISTAELNIRFDTNSAIDAAYNIGRDGNIITNGFTIISTGFNNKNVEPSFSLDENVLSDMLNDISSKLPDKVIESGYYIEDNNLIINKGSDGNVVNVQETLNLIKNSIENLSLINNKIELITSPGSPKKVNLEKIYKKVHKAPVDAKFTAEPLSITPSENGIDFAISMDEAKNKLNEEGNECVIPLQVVYPNVTTNMIGPEAFPDLISSFSTNYAASNYNRTTNLILAANKINGTVLMPGEVFSYNQVVGERSIAAGYKEAPIYVEGRVEDGLGGGICQITTTLYNAVVYADLEVIERTNHQFVPSYVGAGRDATVVYGALDFKFKNNRNYPIKIICSVESGVANFQILGLRTPDDYEVEIVSYITSQTANNINSETYKILSKDGNVVDQVLISRDTYKRH